VNFWIFVWRRRMVTTTHSCSILPSFVSSGFQVQLAKQLSSVIHSGNNCPWRKCYSKKVPRVRSIPTTVVASYNYNIFQDDQDRSRRKVQPGERAYNVKKPLGLVLEEAEDGMVFVADIDPRGNAAQASRGDIRKGDILVAISATFGDEVWSTRGVGLPRVLKGIQVRFGDEVTLVFESPVQVESRKQYSEEFAAKRREEAREKFGEKTVVDPVTWRTVPISELNPRSKEESGAAAAAFPGKKDDIVPKYVKIYQENKDSPKQWIPSSDDSSSSLEPAPDRSGQYILLWSLAGIGLIALTAFFTLR